MTEPKQYDLGALSQIPPGEGRVFKVGDKEVAVFHERGGKVFATQTHCPHMNGPLADGLVGDGKVICPLHERTFNLTSGACVNCEDAIEVYPAVLKEDGVIAVTL